MADMNIPHLRSTLGAVLVGSGFASILTGVVTTQTAYYFQSFPKDKAPMKLMVAVVWLLDLFHTIMIFTSNWSWLIEHFDDHNVADWIPSTLGITVVLTALITIIVHGFFAYRIYRLSKGNWFVVGPILVLALSRLGFASTTCAKMIIYKSFATFIDKASWVFTMGLVASSTLDVVVTACLLWYLDHSRTGFEGMDQIVNTLCRYTIENGLLTSVGIVISLGFWLGMKTNLVFMAIHFVLAKLYANSLLATLNNRRHMRERCGGSASEGPRILNLQRGHTLKCSADATAGMHAIQVNKEIYTNRDEEAGTALSQTLQSQVETVTRKGSMSDTASTSKIKEMFDDIEE